MKKENPIKNLVKEIIEKRIIDNNEIKDYVEKSNLIKTKSDQIIFLKNYSRLSPFPGLYVGKEFLKCATLTKKYTNFLVWLTKKNFYILDPKELVEAYENNPELAEDCDDGNDQNGDGCSSQCLNEGTPQCAKECFNSGNTCTKNNDCDPGEACVDVNAPCCGNGTIELLGSQCPFCNGTGEPNQPAKSYLDSHICQCVFLEREIPIMKNDVIIIH